MKYTVKPTSQFRRDVRRVMKMGLEIGRMEDVIRKLADGCPLPPENRDHPLVGRWKGHRECHIQPDWLLIYWIDRDVLVLTLTRTGTHSELFDE